MNIENILKHYMVCALWSSTDEESNPLDDEYCISDIAPETVETMREDVTSFVASNADLLEESGLCEEQIGHDFWLTRNGHGAGFWDRGLGEIGEEITKNVKPFGGVDLYVFEGKVYA